MSASLSTSLRADYGGALDGCVAIFGRADQHSAGAEGAPYDRLSIKGINVPLFGEEELPLSFGALLHKVRGGLYAGDLVEFFDRLCVKEVAVDGVSLRLHRGTGEPARFTSQNLITICSVERCRTPLSHHGAERACIPQDLAAAMPKVTNMTLRLSHLDKTRSLHNIGWHPRISSQKHNSDKRRNPSDSGSTDRQKGNHARQSNTQLSSSQHR
eukprot:scaffold3801_cov124-Isochrysis_galbana.AAC.7